MIGTICSVRMVARSWQSCSLRLPRTRTRRRCSRQALARIHAQTTSDSGSAHPEGLEGGRGRDGEVAEARAKPTLVEIDPHEAARRQRVVVIGVGVYQCAVDVEQVD